MIARFDLIVRLVTFAAALWIVAVVVWGLATGEKQIETPLIAVWLLIGGMVAQLILWLVRKARRQ